MRLLLFILSLVSSLIVNQTLLVSPAFAQTTAKWTGKCVSTVSYGKKTSFEDIATIQGLECVFYNILQIIVFIAGLGFFIMFIVGGYQYLFSTGDQKKVAAASSTLTMAIIGIIGIILSWIIMSFIKQFTGVNITNFIIPG